MRVSACIVSSLCVIGPSNTILHVRLIGAYSASIMGVLLSSQQLHSYLELFSSAEWTVCVTESQDCQVNFRGFLNNRLLWDYHCVCEYLPLVCSFMNNNLILGQIIFPGKTLIYRLLLAGIFSPEPTRPLQLGRERSGPVNSGTK